jgi:hypothetical protein
MDSGLVSSNRNLAILRSRVHSPRTARRADPYTAASTQTPCETSPVDSTRAQRDPRNSKRRMPVHAGWITSAGSSMAFRLGARKSYSPTKTRHRVAPECRAIRWLEIWRFPRLSSNLEHERSISK